MTDAEFVKTVIPYFQKWGKKFGYNIISVAIAQACLESGYGTSFKATFGHNILGLKYRPNRVTCNNGYFLNGGSEQNPDGSYTPLPSDTAWYNFNTWEDCVHGYYEFINIPNYNAVRSAKTPLEYLQAIKNAGYATSHDYVKNVWARVEKWNLTQYDTAAVTSVQPEVQSEFSIIQRTSTHNTTKQPNRTINWIVLHYTAGFNSAKGSAQNIANYFSRTPNQASADFIVDDVEIVQYNPNPKDQYCWAVGGKKYTSLSTSLGAKYYGQCTNGNSVSIEMCSRKLNQATQNASDDDWYLTDATIDNAAKLTKYLMKLYNIDIDHVIMHHMVTGKWCPQPWCKNPLALTNWYNFLNKVKAGAGSNAAIQPTTPVTSIPAAAYPKTPFLVQVKVPDLNIRKTPNGEKIGRYTGIGKFTITEVQNDWGKLKSSLGYIYLANDKYVTIIRE